MINGIIKDAYFTWHTWLNWTDFSKGLILFKIKNFCDPM